MMIVHALPGNNAQDINNPKPEPGWVEMEGLRPDNEQWWAYVADENGKWVISSEKIYMAEKEQEDAWRAGHMPVALETITAIQLGADDVDGTEQQWKAYWLALRNWTESNPDFPDRNKRPVAPT